LRKVKEILLRHVPDEISTGHNAIAIYISLSEHAERLNKSRFRDCLGSIQRHAFDSFILSLWKLFEPPNKRYPNFSIPTAIQSLQQQLGALNISAQKCAKLAEFVQSEINSSFSVRSGNDLNKVPGLIIGYFGDRCPQTPPRKTYELDVIFDALRVLRDKRVAHHEDNDLQGLSTTDLDGVKHLLAFAETAVNVVGYGFFGFSQQTTVSPEKFSPNKSWLWPQMQRVIQILE
jgi:hypothetical protein